MASLGDVALPDDTLWLDEFDHNPVAMTATRTLGGKLVVQSAVLQGGRPMTLDCGWLDHATLAQLAVLRDGGQPMTVTLPGNRSFTVMFRYTDSPVIEAAPVVPFPDHEADDPFEVKLKLLVM